MYNYNHWQLYTPDFKLLHISPCYVQYKEMTPVHRDVERLSNMGFAGNTNVITVTPDTMERMTTRTLM